MPATVSKYRKRLNYPYPIDSQQKNNNTYNALRKINDAIKLAQSGQAIKVVLKP